MWGLFHQLRTSEEFEKNWTEFLENGHFNTFFCQYVTDEVFNMLIKVDHPGKRQFKVGMKPTNL